MTEPTILSAAQVAEAADYQVWFVDPYGRRMLSHSRSDVAALRDEAEDATGSTAWKFTMYNAEPLCNSHDALQAECARLSANDAAWRARVGALLEYAEHHPRCPMKHNIDMGGCKCGLWEVQLQAQAALDGAAGAG